MSSNTVIASVLTIIQIPSLSCALQILLRFRQNNSPLRRLPNHLLICLLIVSVWTIAIDLPLTQALLWSGFVPIHTHWACVFYNISYFTSTGLNRMLMAFMSIERHFLCFCPHFYRTHRSRLLFHYIPLILIILYILIYFIATNAIVSCSEMHFDYSRFMCGYTCTVLIPNLGIIFTWMFVFLPTVVTIVACILLPVRFVIQKRNLQRLQWYRARKMIIQMSIIASAYTICWFPYTIILQLIINGVIPFDLNISQFFTYGPFATSLLTPFIVLHTVPGWINPAMIERIKRRLFPQRQSTVRPQNIVVAQQLNRIIIKEQNQLEQMTT